MKSLKRTITVILLILFATNVIKAESDQVQLKVGETAVLKIPSSVTTKTGFQVISSWRSINGSGYIDYSGYGSSVTVTVNSYTSNTIYLTCDYEYSSIFGDKYTGQFEFRILISEPYFNFSASPRGGTVKKGQIVTFDCWIDNVYNFSNSQGDVKIYYTLDGATPSRNSTLYNAFYPVTIDKTCTLQAIATWKGVESSVLREYYTVEDNLYLTAKPEGGVVEKGTIVYLTANEYGADIYYTLDGYTPSRSSTPYSSSGITINEDCTLKAIAYKDGITSDVLSESYRIAVDPTRITVSLSSSTIRIGDIATAEYTLSPSNARSTVTWSSENPNIASVDRNKGKVVGVSEGKTNIIATTSNGLTAQCSITVSGESNIYVNAINFPDVNFRSSILEQGIRTEEDVRKADRLDVARKEIESLKGIELFTSLETLTCGSNKLTSLDVSDNTKLTTISCYGNRIHGANLDAFINSLPNNNTSNKRLIVDNTMYKITDYSSEGLSTSQVAKAKGKGWTPLYWCIMDDEYYEYEGYEGSSIDNTNIAIDATNFPDENFRQYLLEQDFGKDGVITPDENGQIKKIYCVGKGIRNLKGIEFFIYLDNLDCLNNQLSTLDVSKNTALEHLACDQNQLTSLDLSNNKALKTLWCNSNQLTKLDLSNNVALETLWCYDNQISTLNISNSTALINLECQGNQIISLDVSKNLELNRLWCDFNQLTSLDVSKNTYLTDLSCSRNKIRGGAMDDLVKSLPMNTTKEEHKFVVISNSSNEGNVCTKDQVAIAKSRGWTSYCGSEKYEGSDPTAIDGVVTDVKEGAPIYNLNGQRIDKPRKGINIIGGKKVVIK